MKICLLFVFYIFVKKKKKYNIEDIIGFIYYWWLIKFYNNGELKKVGVV